jgi:ABC-type nitrate/sulfonate/bicarbonate transport system permease component
MVMFIFFATVPFVFTDTVRTIALVPERFVETAQTLGASRFQIITKVLFPLALPDIVTSLRFLFGLAFGYIALVEAINVRAGLGFADQQQRALRAGHRLPHAVRDRAPGLRDRLDAALLAARVFPLPEGPVT